MPYANHQAFMQRARNAGMSGGMLGMFRRFGLGQNYPTAPPQNNTPVSSPGTPMPPPTFAGAPTGPPTTGGVMPIRTQLPTPNAMPSYDRSGFEFQRQSRRNFGGNDIYDLVGRMFGAR